MIGAESWSKLEGKNGVCGIPSGYVTLIALWGSFERIPWLIEGFRRILMIRG